MFEAFATGIAVSLAAAVVVVAIAYMLIWTPITAFLRWRRDPDRVIKEFRTRCPGCHAHIWVTVKHGTRKGSCVHCENSWTWEDRRIFWNIYTGTYAKNK